MADSTQVIEAYSFRKAAVAFVENEVSVEAQDVVVVEFGSESQKFTASELVLKDGWKLGEIEEDSAEEVEQGALRASAETNGVSLGRSLLRMESAYSSIRVAINILAVLAYISVTVTLVISLGGGIKMESIELMLMALFGAVVSVLLIYVLKHLLHAFLDIADAHIRKLD
ncbi:hypothetical protein [Rubritalea sp.]|uniref:hypothetical protein n=1 Tax=Rubritalea sp. TaxID=2109375 RepID=UPI003EF32C0C